MSDQIRSDQIGLMLEQLVAVDVQQGGVNVVVVGVGEDEVVAVLFKREVDGCVDEDLIAVGDGEVLDGVAADGELKAIRSGSAAECVVAAPTAECVVTASAP